MLFGEHMVKYSARFRSLSSSRVVALCLAVEEECSWWPTGGEIKISPPPEMHLML